MFLSPLLPVALDISSVRQSKNTCGMKNMIYGFRLIQNVVDDVL